MQQVDHSAYAAGKASLKELNNPDFKPLEFEGFRKNVGRNAFTLSPKKTRNAYVENSCRGFLRKRKAPREAPTPPPSNV
jgi:hypothetical protein